MFVSMARIWRHKRRESNWRCNRGWRLPGLNTVIRAVAKASAQRGWETLGILGGYQGLLEPCKYRELDYRAIDGLLVRGGTILGTANRGRFSAKVGHGENRKLSVELINEVKQSMKKLGLSALVSIGGDGSLSIGLQMHEQGIPIVGVPKTIDNDLQGTLMTFGFDSAVACATDALDRLHTTAESHNRVMVIEVMGRYAGWIALYSGSCRRRGRSSHSRNPIQLRERLRENPGSRETRKTLHPRCRCRGSARQRRGFRDFRSR